MRTRVIVVEDHADFRYLMVTLLDWESDLDAVAQAESLAEACCHAAPLKVDESVLDFGLPNGDGADLNGDLHEANPSVTVLILSASPDPQNRERSTEAWADEVLDKLASTTEVAGAIRRLGGGWAEATLRVRTRLTPLLTPLSAQHPETVSDREQGYRHM